MPDRPGGARPPSGEDAVAVFDGQADRWDTGYDRVDAHGAWLRARLAAVVDTAGPGPGDALDVGMGTGRLVEALVARGWAAHGVDGSEQMVEVARARLAGTGAETSVARAEALPFPEASLDLVTMVGVVRFLPDLQAALAEVARVLRPDGRFVVTAARAVSWGRLARRLRLARPLLSSAPPGSWRYAGALERGLVQAGFSVVCRRPIASAVVPEPLDRAVPALAARLAAGAERRGRFARYLLATQVLLVARPPSGGQPSPSAAPVSRRS